MTKDRWLSESIEGDLEHTGDELEELLEEELVELDWEGPFPPSATSGTTCGSMFSRANGLLSPPLRSALPSKPWWPCSLNLATWAVKTRKIDAGAHAGLGVSAVDYRRPWHRMRGLTRALVDQGVEIGFVLPRPVESRVVDGVRVLSPGCEELTSATKDESPTPTADQKLGIPREPTPPPRPYSSAGPAYPTPPQLLDPIPGLPELNLSKPSGLESIGSNTRAIFLTLSTPPQNPWPPFANGEREPHPSRPSFG